MSDAAAECRHPQTYQNALKTELAVFTGLRNAELHSLTPRHIVWEKGLVRVGAEAKGSKPRIAAFINGLGASPTLAKVRDWLEDRGRRLDDARPLWTSGDAAFWHWVTHRLGPYSGLQRTMKSLVGNKTLYRVHPHALRAAFVMICRRGPPERGELPVEWPAIAQLGGWDSVDTLQHHYYVSDLPNVLDEVARKLGGISVAPPA